MCSMTSKQVTRMISEIVGNDVKTSYDAVPSSLNPHYFMTPYRFTPRTSTKIVPSEFIELGQGILEIVEEFATRNRAQYERIVAA